MSRPTHPRFPLVRVVSFALASCALLAPRADAALVLSVGSISVPKPAVGTRSFSLSVFAEAQGGTEDLNSFTFPFDISPPAGAGLPGGMQPPSPLSSSAIVSFSYPADTDLLVDGLTAGLSLSDGESAELFTLLFTIEDTIALGEYTVDLDESDARFTVDGPTSISDIIDGTITITAVPEPGSMSAMALVAIGAIGVAHRRRTRKPIEDKAS